MKSYYFDFLSISKHKIEQKSRKICLFTASSNKRLNIICSRAGDILLLLLGNLLGKIKAYTRFLVGLFNIVVPRPRKGLIPFKEFWLFSNSEINFYLLSIFCLSKLGLVFWTVRQRAWSWLYFLSRISTSHWISLLVIIC